MKNNSTPESLHFCDLSIDLDRRLEFLSHLLEVSRVYEDSILDIESETAHFLFEYLAKRAVLEHVFFGRPLGKLRLETSKLKAELWRVSKLKAAAALRNKTIL